MTDTPFNSFAGIVIYHLGTISVYVGYCDIRCVLPIMHIYGKYIYISR